MQTLWDLLPYRRRIPRRNLSKCSTTCSPDSINWPRYLSVDLSKLEIYLLFFCRSTNSSGLKSWEIVTTASAGLPGKPRITRCFASTWVCRWLKLSSKFYLDCTNNADKNRAERRKYKAIDFVSASQRHHFIIPFVWIQLRAQTAAIVE